MPSVALRSCLVFAAAILAGCVTPPRTAFEVAAAPGAPDYARPEAWLALPGRDGLERSAPQGLTPVDEATAPADVFFIHPTTTTSRDVWNVSWDATGAAAPLNPPVLLQQVGVFNGCCRLYAPRYRQVTLSGLGETRALDLAYEDVARAFRTFIAAHNDGRPFIVASHSQGTMHALRLVQEEIAGTPLQDRLVAAYLIGGYVPADIAGAGLPVCDDARQTGCVVSWNAAKPGARTARLVIDDKTYWWRGAWRSEDQPPALCVNPLTWRAGETAEAAPAAANPGSMPLPREPYPEAAAVLPALDPQLTGARCHDGMLEVSLPEADGVYGDPLTRLAGSYHLNDYGLFYQALRTNASDRIAAWRAAHR